MGGEREAWGKVCYYLPWVLKERGEWRRLCVGAAGLSVHASHPDSQALCAT